MDELFEQVNPDHPLEWTGERLTTETTGQVEVEHLHRYFVARYWARGLDVLDIASGEGYGSALLAQTARSAVGIEIDQATVEHARAAYVAPNDASSREARSLFPWPTSRSTSQCRLKRSSTSTSKNSFCGRYEGFSGPEEY